MSGARIRLTPFCPGYCIGGSRKITKEANHARSSLYLIGTLGGRVQSSRHEIPVIRRSKVPIFGERRAPGIFVVRLGSHVLLD